MSWRIKEIEITGFKFFKDSFPIVLDGCHALIYGENGSGKSSIYWSLYTFFQACLKTQEDAQKYYKTDHPQNLRNRFCDKDDKSSISVSFVDDTSANIKKIEISNELYPFANDEVKTFMEKSMMSSDFMNYKFLQKIFDFPNSKENDVFDIFEKEVFKYLLFSKPLTDIDGNLIYKADAEYWWSYIQSVPKILPKNTGRNRNTINMGTPKYKSFVRLIDDFNKEMKKALFNLKFRTEKICRESFNDPAEIQFDYSPVVFNCIRPGTHKSHDGVVHKPRIIMTAKMSNDGVVDNSPIHHPNSFFNEAKLTCKSLALRMAILGEKPTFGPDYASVLLLDDLLISLDMGYRRRVIDAILRYRFGRQLIILTHDRSFFTLVESEIERKRESEEWKFLEMCIDEDSTTPSPMILENGDLISKARLFYHRHEYPACANTLRRAYENTLKRLYPAQFSFAVKQDNLENPYQNLNGLISNLGKFRGYYCGFPDIAPNLTNDRRLILNPFSHDDLDTPLFKRELRESIEQLELLNGASKETIVDSDKVHIETFRMEMCNGEYVSFAEFSFLGIWDRILYDGQYYYGNPKVRISCVSDNVEKIKSIVVLNCLHHAVRNAVSLNEDTAPSCYDCVKPVSG